MATKFISRSIDVQCVRGSYKGCKTTLIVVKETPKLLHTRPNPKIGINTHTTSERKNNTVVWCKTTKSRRYDAPMANTSIFVIMDIEKEAITVKDKTSRAKKVDSQPLEDVKSETPNLTLAPKHVGMFNAFKRQMQSKKDVTVAL